MEARVITVEMGAGPQRLPVDQIRPESVFPVPDVFASLQASTEGLSVRFTVKREVGFHFETRGFQGPVHLDSCVEVFLSPPGETAYLNVECNAGGDLHTSWIRNPARKPEGGFEDYRLLTAEDAAGINCTPSTRPGSQDWELSVYLPWVVFRPFVPNFHPCGPWRMNLYKCADASSHPHWLSWAPCGEKNFHVPDEFGLMQILSEREREDGYIG